MTPNPRLATFDPTVLGAVRRFGRVVLALVVAGALVGAVVGLVEGPTSAARAGIVLAPLPEPITPAATGHGEQAALYVNQQAGLIQSYRVTTRAAAMVDSEDSGAHLTRQSLYDHMTVTPGSLVPTSGSGKNLGATTLVVVTLGNRNQSIEAANAVLRAYEAVLKNLITTSATNSINAINGSLNSATNALNQFEASVTTQPPPSTTTTTLPPRTTTTTRPAPPVTRPATTSTTHPHRPRRTTTTTAATTTSLATATHRRNRGARAGRTPLTTIATVAVPFGGPTTTAPATATSAPAATTGPGAPPTTAAPKNAGSTTSTTTGGNGGGASAGTSGSGSPAVTRRNLTQAVNNAAQAKSTLALNEQIDLAYKPTVYPATTNTTATQAAPWLRNLVIGALVGLVVGLVVAYVLAIGRRRFEHEHDPERLYGAPLLAAVPAPPTYYPGARWVPVAADPASDGAEAFRLLATALRSRRGDAESLVVLCTAAAPGAGTTTVVANTGLALAEMGERVLVVDADPVHRGLARLLDVEVAPGTGSPADARPPGLAEVLDGRALVDSLQPARANEALMVLPAGRDGEVAVRRWRPGTLRAALDDASDRFSMVLVDAPPVGTTSFAMDLAAAARRVVMVVPHHDEVAPHLEVPGRLATAGATVEGYVYNRAPVPTRHPAYLPALRRTPEPVAAPVAPDPRPRPPAPTPPATAPTPPATAPADGSAPPADGAPPKRPRPPASKAAGTKAPGTKAAARPRPPAKKTPAPPPAGIDEPPPGA